MAETSGLPVKRYDSPDVLQSLFRDHREFPEIRRTERCSIGHICCIPPGCHEKSTNSRDIMACIKAPPAVLQVNPKPRTEIHRRRRDGHADVAEIASGITSRNIQTPAQRDGQMLEIPADSYPFVEYFESSSRGPCILISERHMIVYPIANC